ncbi:MAG: KpsF/GutQ family sugar-phosphate isomerase [Acidobacteriota bacterium]|nr:KpsF/GutQ family sugar-phosphate isomerase [Acidobacteriota bacterium]
MKIKADNVCVSRFAELLELEAAAVTKAARGLQPAEVERAVELLAVCQGKVVVFGVGKSGIVARKVAATLTSTGTGAIFLHPSDALHGDIGCVSSADVAVLLSNSGETDELLILLPHLKRRQIPCIAIVGNLRSTLACSADAVLDASVDREACPFNLAPTASTTVALAIGDALAITLMEVKGVSPHDFAQNHPAGRLGKRLTLRVGDLMHSGARHPTVSPHELWFEVVSRITAGGLGAVCVTDDALRLVGLITDGDLRRAVRPTELMKLETFSAGALMTRNPVVVSPETLAYDALQMMENRPTQISVLPVVDNEARCVGLVRIHDIVRSGI